MRGIPGILSDGTIRTVVRPYLSGKENHWKNILSVLFLEPEEVLFVPVDEEQLMKNSIVNFSDFGETAQNICMWAEGYPAYRERFSSRCHRLDAEELGRLYEYPALRNKRRVMVKNRKLIGLDDPIVEMHAREIHLTVEEMFYLFEAYMDSDKKEI